MYVYMHLAMCVYMFMGYTYIYSHAHIATYLHIHGATPCCRRPPVLGVPWAIVRHPEAILKPS